MGWAHARTRMASVKDLRVESPPARDELGRGVFEFSDRYSVFDWGEMPDRIPGKGASLATMGAFTFELLATAEVPTHYRGVRTPDGDTVDLADAPAAPTEMVVGLTRVPDLPFEGGRYDYDAYHEAAGDNYLVPLEVVFRNSVPVGSSLRSRCDPVDVGLDASEWPDEPVDLPETVIEFSTKYEEQDRYLSKREADRVAGAVDLAELDALARRVNEVVTERAAETGFVHEDGKIECLYVDGELRVADVAGTFDENRFRFEGREVSKEAIRQFYKRTDPEWVEAVRTAKREADERDVADWKSLCEASPDPLPAEVRQAAADLYAAGANRYTGHDWFADAPPLGDALEAFE